jgi:hypothetical protein
VTPPLGAQNPTNPTQAVPGWQPDLTKVENRFTLAMMVRL